MAALNLWETWDCALYGGLMAALGHTWLPPIWGHIALLEGTCGRTVYRGVNGCAWGHKWLYSLWRYITARGHTLSLHSIWDIFLLLKTHVAALSMGGFCCTVYVENMGLHTIWGLHGGTRGTCCYTLWGDFASFGGVCDCMQMASLEGTCGCTLWGEFCCTWGAHVTALHMGAI